MSNQSINFLGRFDPMRELDGRTTPPPSNNNNNSNISPTKKGVEKVKQLIGNRGPEDGGAFEKKDLDLVNKTFTLIKDKDSPVRKRHATELQSAALNATQFSPGSPDVIQPEYSNILDPKRRSCIGVKQQEALSDFLFSWGNTILSNTGKILKNSREKTVLVNLEHILKPTPSGKNVTGLHFICEENAHLEKDIETLAANPTNGVYFGIYRSQEAPKGKSSMFFPRAIHSKENLLALLGSATVVVEGLTSSLLHIGNNWNITVECYMKNEYAMWSVFPLFFYGEYNPTNQLQVTEQISLAPQQIPDLVKGLPVKYEIDNDVIVDISGKILGLVVDKGIYLRVPRQMVTPARRVVSMFSQESTK